MIAVIGLAAINPRTRLGIREVAQALRKASMGGLALIAAASSVGIVIGVVTLTGVGTDFRRSILPLAQENLPLALVVIMVSSIVLGMGLPSAVCYLLMATLIGPVLGKLGVVPLAAHLFIFYFGMMSMVTPPVALAAYAASSIAGSKLLETGVSAFRFALVGFTLPYMFVFRPQLLMLDPGGGPAALGEVLASTALAAAGIAALALAIVGFARRQLLPFERLGFLLIAALLLYPGGAPIVATTTGIQFVGLGLLAALWLYQARWAPARQG